MKKKILITGSERGLSLEIGNRIIQDEDNEVFYLRLRDSIWNDNSFDNIKTVIHIAGITPQNAVNAQQYYDVNSNLTKELAIKAKAAGVRRFVFLSSMAVYGCRIQLNPDECMVSAGTQCHPMDDYGKSKLNAERMLDLLADDHFKVTSIRVPSIFGKGKTLYLDQYKYLAEKLPIIPKAFTNCLKSAISLESLCELIYLVEKHELNGVLCPDDGPFSAFDLCSAIYPNKKKSRLLGFGIEMIMSKNERVIDYYGSVFYSPELSNILNGEYRVMTLRESVKKAYE